MTKFKINRTAKIHLMTYNLHHPETFNLLHLKISINPQIYANFHKYQLHVNKLLVSKKITQILPSLQNLANNIHCTCSNVYDKQPLKWAERTWPFADVREIVEGLQWLGRCAVNIRWQSVYQNIIRPLSPPAFLPEYFTYVVISLLYTSIYIHTIQYEKNKQKNI